MFVISTSRSCCIPAFTTRRRSSVAMWSLMIAAIGVPVANRELGPESFDDSARRGLQSSILRVHFVELRERGVEVSLFENLSAVDQATVERREVDHAPLGIETLL